MKKQLILILITLLPFSYLHGQEDQRPSRSYEYHTIFGQRPKVGAYGALSIGYSSIDGRDALLTGARAEWVIGHGFGMGVGGFGFVNDPFYDNSTQLYYNLVGGYGGLVFEPILFWNLPVHLSFPVLVGAGGVALTSFSENLYDPYQYFDSYLEDVNVFLVAEPSVELELNMLRFFRIAFYGSWRFTTDLLLENSAPDALNGWSAGITFKFGSF